MTRWGSYNKYANTRVTIDGHTFDSKMESQRYIQLKLLLKAGEIRHLLLQPQFELQPGFTTKQGKRIRPLSYVADFQYVEGKTVVVEDVKGFQTEAFKLKAKLFQYRYPQYEFRLIEKV